MLDLINMIPVCEPTLTGKEKEYVNECLDTNWISSGGKFIERFESGFSFYIGAKHGVSCSNGSTALHLAVEALGIGPGDEVIVPNFTIISCANAIVQAGAKPVFVDVDKRTWNLDDFSSKITSRTKAVMPVHMFGHPCNMDKVVSVARDNDLSIIEDCAEAHGAEFRGKKVGTFGDVSCFSFYANKLITTGEGGMVLTSDSDVAEKLRLLRNLAFTKQRFVHHSQGYNYRMTNIQAAIGLAQLESVDKFVNARIKNAQLYNKLLSGAVRTPICEDYAKNVYWMYSVLLKDKDRDTVMKALGSKGIQTRTLFHPLHRQPIFNHPGEFPVSEDLWKRGFYLPSSSSLSEDKIRFISETLLSILDGNS